MTAITYDDFAALVADLVTAMTTAGVAAPDQMAILDALAPMCDQIRRRQRRASVPGNNKAELVETAGIALNCRRLRRHPRRRGLPRVRRRQQFDGVEFFGNVALTIGLDHTSMATSPSRVMNPQGKLPDRVSTARAAPSSPRTRRHELLRRQLEDLLEATR